MRPPARPHLGAGAGEPQARPGRSCGGSRGRSSILSFDGFERSSCGRFHDRALAESAAQSSPGWPSQRGNTRHLPRRCGVRCSSDARPLTERCNGLAGFLGPLQPPRFVRSKPKQFVHSQPPSSPLRRGVRRAPRLSSPASALIVFGGTSRGSSGRPGRPSGTAWPPSHVNAPSGISWAARKRAAPASLQGPARRWRVTALGDDASRAERQFGISALQDQECARRKACGDMAPSSGQPHISGPPTPSRAQPPRG